MAKVDVWALTDLSTPWCVHVAVTLRIAEHIAAGKTEIADLASASGSDRDSLHRVLRHLVGRGVFDEPQTGRFALNEAARALIDPSARHGFDLDGFGGRMAHAWGSLLTAVRTGAPAYHTVFGRPFWDDLQAHPEISKSFDALMGPGHGTPDPDVLVSGGWESVKTVVDVGGGTGSLLAEVLRARPTVRGTLVDLPQTLARSKEVFEEKGVAERVTTVGQREATALLKRCAEAAHPAGRVVLLNGVSPDEKGGPSPALLMLVLVGGKDRSLSEFRELAKTAGLEVTAAERQASGRFVVECQPR